MKDKYDDDEEKKTNDNQINREKTITIIRQETE